MNERIKELAAQATRQYSPTYYTQEWIQGFAELIIRECIKESMEEIGADEVIAKENDPLFRAYLKGNNQGIVDAVVRLRNHFGVEE